MVQRVIVGQLRNHIEITGTNIPDDTYVKEGYEGGIQSGGTFYPSEYAFTLTNTPSSSPSGSITLKFKDGSTFTTSSYTYQAPPTGFNAPTTTTVNGPGGATITIYPPWIKITGLGTSNWDYSGGPTDFSAHWTGGDPEYGVRVSKPGLDVNPDTWSFNATENLLFDSTSGRTAQIYAGGAGINYGSTSTLYFRNRGTQTITGTPNLSGKKIIINGTTVTVSSTATTILSIASDINNASITGVSTASSINGLLNIQASAGSGTLTVSYPSSDSLFQYVGNPAITINETTSESVGTNFLSTGSKANLGYIPLVIISERNKGEVENNAGDESTWTQDTSMWQTTSTTITPITITTTAPVNGLNGTSQLAGSDPNLGRNYDGVGSASEDAREVSFFVLRMPCAYGYMTSSYFG